MIKIDHYKLQNFRNIRSADLRFENYNVIIGSNNSGKSNFIQSFAFLNFVISGAMDEVSEAFFNGFAGTSFRNVLPTNYHITEDAAAVPLISAGLDFSNTETGRKFSYALSIAFKVQAEDAYAVSFYIESESLYYKDQGKPGAPTRIFDRRGDKSNYGTAFPQIKALRLPPDTVSLVRIIQLLGIGQEAYTDAVQSLSHILKTPIFYFSPTELALGDRKDRKYLHNGRIVSFDLEQEIIGLKTVGSWEIFETALNHILGIKDVRVVEYAVPEQSKSDHGKPGQTVMLLHNNSYKSLGDLSDGSLLLIALIVKVLNSEQDIFFIEEPENSTHPKALVDLINFLQSFTTEKQFIVTSHSIVLLNKSKLDQIITGTISSNGYSELSNVSSRADLKTRLKSGLVDFSDELFFADQLHSAFD